MNLTFICGQVRVEAEAFHRHGQHLAAVLVNGAARPRTLIARVVLDDSTAFGNKGGRMQGGWHLARCIGRRRLAALAYSTESGLPISERQLHAPAFAWWPQWRGARA